MCAEPFLHVSLVLVFGGLVSKYVRHFAGPLVVGSGDRGVLRRRASRDEPSRLSAEEDLKSRMWSIHETG
jgi:hypothetical protein